MPDPVRGLAEMARVTRPGGVVAACVWDHAGGMGPLGLFWQAARELDPTVVDESRPPGTREGHLRQLFVEAGLREVAETTLTADLEHPDFDAWWAPFAGGCRAGRRLHGRPVPGRSGRTPRAAPRAASGLARSSSARAWAARGLV